MEIVSTVIAVLLALLFGWTLGKTIVLSIEIKDIEEEIDELRKK